MDRGLIVVIGGVDTVDKCLQASHGGVLGCGQRGGLHVDMLLRLCAVPARHQTHAVLHTSCTGSSSGTCG